MARTAHHDGPTHRPVGACWLAAVFAVKSLATHANQRRFVAMPRYFFHLRDDEELIRDDEGTELPDLSAARTEAAQTAKEIINESIGSGEPLDHLVVEIWDEAGVIEAVTLSVVLSEDTSQTIH